MLGTVASMSTAPVSVDRAQVGAYSLIMSAAAREMGPAMRTATTAMPTEPTSRGMAPKWPLSGDQVESVKKWIPPFSSAFQPLAVRKTTTAARITSTTALEEARAKRKIRSARVTARLMTMGLSSMGSIGGVIGGAMTVIGSTSGARCGGPPGRHRGARGPRRQATMRRLGLR